MHCIEHTTIPGDIFKISPLPTVLQCPGDIIFPKKKINLHVHVLNDGLLMDYCEMR